VNGTFATCWDLIKDIKMTPHAPIQNKDHQRRVPVRPLAASWPTRTSEACTINTSGFDFRQGHQLASIVTLSSPLVMPGALSTPWLTPSQKN
jgi:hypothetical protein